MSSYGLFYIVVYRVPASGIWSVLWPFDTYYYLSNTLELTTNRKQVQVFTDPLAALQAAESDVLTQPPAGWDGKRMIADL